MGIDMSVLMGANIANEVAAEKFCETTIGKRGKNYGVLTLLPTCFLHPLHFFFARSLVVTSLLAAKERIKFIFPIGGFGDFLSRLNYSMLEERCCWIVQQCYIIYYVKFYLMPFLLLCSRVQFIH